MLVFIGTQGSGVHAAVLDEETGALDAIGLVAELERPTWVLTDRRRPMLYAVSEVGNAGDRLGEVVSFQIDVSSGTLRETARTPSGGGGPTHLDTALDGRSLFVANFGGGQVASVPIEASGGLGSARSVMINSGSGPHRRQQGPHAHGVTIDRSGRYLLAPDMGADRIFVYPYDGETGLLGQQSRPAEPLPAGAGPRLILFGKDGCFAYLLTELSAEIYVFAWDSDRGALALRSKVALDPPASEAARSAAAFAMSDDGRVLYASNRTTNAIHVYAVDADEGSLAEIQIVDVGGVKPWSAEIATDGRWLLVANQGSDEVKVFGIDRGSGALVPTAGSLSVPTPTGIAFFAPSA